MKQNKKIALVTGGTRGIGKEISLMLARNNYEVWINYNHNDDAAHNTIKEIEKLNTDCKLLKFDVGNFENVKQVLQPELEHNSVSVLINNAGTRRDGLFMWMNYEDWKHLVDVNLNSIYNVTRLVISGMIKNKYGRIINLSSTSGQAGFAGQVNYCATKAGIIGASKALAKEVAKRNVLVNVVSPGFIETELTADVDKKDIARQIPMGRWGTSGEVAAVIEFLISEKASYISGQVIGVNGGIY